MGQNETPEGSPLVARSRPQFHYFYGSTDNANALDTSNEQEQDSLIGEELVPTDHEEDTPTSSDHDLQQHLFVTNGNSTKPWFLGSPAADERSNGNNGLGRILTIILLAALCSTFLIVFLPHSSEPLPPSQSVFIPFQEVDRRAYGDPVEGFVDLSLFHPSLLSDSDPRTFVFPFPTGAFWTNLVVSSPDNEISYPVVVYPYAYKWSSAFMQLSYPAARRITTERSVIDPFAPEMTISTVEQIANRYVTKFDPLSVTLRFIATSTSKWETALVQGSPYATMKYLNATPVFRPLSIFKQVQCPGDDEENFSDLIDENSEERRRLFGVCSIDDSKKDQILLRGVQFIFKTPEGVTWVLFSSEPMNLVFDSIRKTTITSSAPFTGIIRLAYIPAKDAADQYVDSSTALRRLIYHAGVYPVGGQVSWEFHTTQSSSKISTSAQAVNSTSRSAIVRFSYATRTMTDNSLRPNAATNSLLMLSLPHHAKLLPKGMLLDRKQFDFSYHCIKGALTPVVGSTWSYEEPLLDLEFDGPSIDLDPGVKGVILDQVREDLTRVLPTAAENVYGFGKQVARLAQLAHIADNLCGHEDLQQNENGCDVRERSSSLLASYLEMFLSSGVVDSLLFDTNLGGIVSNNGLFDKGADFGNGRYNDHHFHYGYLLYASAIMAKIDPSFKDRFGVHVDTIFHDVAHSGNSDSRRAPSTGNFFPFTRHKSWFDGHSFANGMFPFGTGKSQESSSEAVNCYYGAYLWSLVRHGETSAASDLTDFARLLLAMEIRGTKTYWHMLPPKESSTGNNHTKSTQIYPDEFLKNYMVGNVGMLDVSANTWFGNDLLYVHMINVIPVTAATAVLFDKEYVEQEYKFLLGNRNEVEMAWRGYTVSIHAIVDSSAAWEEASTLVSPELDSALSKSQVLYWISHRPGFNVTVATNPKPQDEDASSASSSASPISNDDEPSTATDSAACESHHVCKNLGLAGKCCPTVEGVVLGCCRN